MNSLQNSCHSAFSRVTQFFWRQIICGVLYFFLFFQTVQAEAQEAWQVVHPDPGVSWQYTQTSVTGEVWWANSLSFLVSNSAFFPIQPDFIWEFTFTPQQGMDHNMVWGFIDEHNYYQLHAMGGALWVNRFIGGQEMLARGVNFSWAHGSSYRVKIKRKNGLLSISVDGQLVLHFMDTTYDPVTSIGAWGFKMQPGSIFSAVSVFTDIVFFSEDRIFLPVQRFTQNDPFWSNDIYDHATVWSDQPLLTHWGCAVTSLAMLLDFHGFTTLLDGTTLTPSSLNHWLQQEPDGYIGQGLVNWWAATRLVRQLSMASASTSRPLPKLEFAAASSNWEQAAKDDIANGNPVIAQIPGHFTVLHGIYEETGDFVVSDPYYDKQRSSEYDVPITSVRLFRPSFTDLSALVVVHEPTQQVQFLRKEENGWVVLQESHGLRKWSEFLFAVESLSKTQELAFTVVEKPATGVYEMRVSGSSSSFSPQLLAYSETAEVTTVPLDISENPLPLRFLFQKTGGVEKVEFADWDIFLQTVDIFSEQKRISSFLAERLKKIATDGKNHSDPSAQQRVKAYLQTLFLFAEPYHDALVFSSLQEIVYAIPDF